MVVITAFYREDSNWLFAKKLIGSEEGTILTFIFMNNVY